MTTPSPPKSPANTPAAVIEWTVSAQPRASRPPATPPASPTAAYQTHKSLCSQDFRQAGAKALPETGEAEVMAEAASTI